jgi:polyhydroxybutyrate depolymerase
MSNSQPFPAFAAIAVVPRIKPSLKRRIVRWMMLPIAAVVLTFLFSLSVLMSAPADATDRMERSVRVNGMTREYTLYMPRTAEDGHQHPVLFVFHPGGAQASFMEENAPFFDAAGAEDYVVIYPEGISRTFNAGVCCGGALEKGIDDVAFFKAMMKDINKIVPIRDKAYLTGFSNGGMLSYRLVCEVPQMVAAAVPFAGAVPMDNCVSGTAVPMMHLNGGADTQSLYGGERNMKSRFKKTSSTLTPPLEALGAVAKRNGCAQELVPARSMPAMDADCERFAGCPSTGPVLMCVIPELGHAWPGSGEGAMGGGGENKKRAKLFSRLGRNKKDDNAAGGNEMADRLGPYRPELDAEGSIVAFFNRF